MNIRIIEVDPVHRSTPSAPKIIIVPQSYQVCRQVVPHKTNLFPLNKFVPAEQSVRTTNSSHQANSLKIEENTSQVSEKVNYPNSTEYQFVEPSLHQEKTEIAECTDYETFKIESKSQEEIIPSNKPVPKKTHACGYCDKKFTTKKSLRIHTRTHTGEKPYKCDHCDYAATTNGNLRKHIKNKHKQSPSTSSNNEEEKFSYYISKPPNKRTSPNSTEHQSGDPCPSEPSLPKEEIENNEITDNEIFKIEAAMKPGNDKVDIPVETTSEKTRRETKKRKYTPVKVDGRKLRHQRKLIPFSCCKAGCDYIGTDENDMRRHKRHKDSQSRKIWYFFLLPQVKYEFRRYNMRSLENR